jgi:hypothetical protein
MDAALPLDMLETNQPDKGLVHQSSRVQGVPHPLARHVMVCDAMQLVVEKRDQLVHRVPASRRELIEELSDPACFYHGVWSFG